MPPFLLPMSSPPYQKMSAHPSPSGELETVKIVVLGASGVGKTSIIQQFVTQTFTDQYEPTSTRQLHHPCLILNERLYEAQILDCPPLPYFPVNTLYEWSEFRGYGLRNATAYILVYDITREDSFNYIRTLRDQIVESRDTHDVPMYVVGNKHDLAEGRGLPRREVANMVKKQWKCGYVECSAKYNWHIIMLFKELMRSVENIDHSHKPTSMRVQDALRRNRCVILWRQRCF